MFDIVSFIKTLGYLGIFGVVFAESGLFVGFFLPGDSLLFTAGFLASQGFLNIWYLVILTAIGAILGNNFGYAFGKKVGPMIFKKEDSLLFHKDYLRKAEVFYGKYGGRAIVLARFMPGVRTFIPILAGVGKMDYKKFLIFNAIGCALWGIGLPFSGYLLGNLVPDVDKYIIPIILLIIILSVLPIIFNFFKDEIIRKKILKLLGFKSKYQDKLICFNWKMEPETLGEAIKISKESDHENTAVFPPFIFVEEIGKIIKKAKLGAQDLFCENIKSGPFTGEISASELANLGVRYVIIGHSERRAMGEGNETISKKIKTALDSGLIPILCIGESLEEHKNNLTKKVIEDQIRSGLSLVVGRQSLVVSQLIVAYEPIWAIGTGSPETPESALETIRFIKNLLVISYYLPDIKVLYGGSVNSENINDFLKYKEIDGVLVGGASLNPKLFF